MTTTSISDDAVSREVVLPYGPELLRTRIDWGRPLGVIDVADAPAIADPAAAARAALMQPLGGTAPLSELSAPGRRIVIVVSDSFRKTEIHRILPTLLETLTEAGAAEEDISFVYSTGTHRGPTEAEQSAILGPEVYARFRQRAFAHDPNDPAQLVKCGVTRRGTPVELNRRVVEADCVIVTGTVVLHYFGGFGGGRKSILPGVASARTIAHNHSLNLDPREDRLNPAVRIGALDGNPVAEDMLEGARFCRVDFTINTVLNRRGEIAGLFAGDLVAAHRAACDFAYGLYAVPIQERADLVIATAGAAKNFIQSHKALFNAYQALKPGGRIVFCCWAPEGYGGNRFAHWMGLGSREAIIAELRTNAEINGQTALSTIEKAAITSFVTEMSEQEVQALGGTKCPTLEQALAHARESLDRSGVKEPSYYVMPSASYSVPIPRQTSAGEAP